MKLRCLAVDDERLALDLLEDNISKIPYLELVGRCKNAFEVMEKMQIFRCQKSFIVNLKKVQSLRNSELFIEKYKIPFSESGREELMLRLGV